MVTPLLQIGDTQRQLIGLWLPAGGQQLLQQFADGTLLVWDLARGAPVASLSLRDGDRPLVFDTESRMLQLLRDGRLLLLPSTGAAQPLAAAPAALLTAIADGPRCWAGTREGQVLLLAGNGTLRRQVPTSLSAVNGQGQLRALYPPPAEHGAIRQLAASPDDDAVAAVTERGALWLWQAGGWHVIDARTAAVVCLGRGRFLHARPDGVAMLRRAGVGSQRVEQDGRLLLADVFELQAERGANELFAEARNVHGLAGRSAVLRQVTPGFQAAGRLQLVGVAIDRYRVPAMNLDYAKADVQALVQATERAAGGTYAAVGRSLLTDEQATRRGVLDLLQSLQRLQPQDVLLLVLAGHGTLERDEWFFLPHDVDPSDVRRQGLSARELQDALVAAPARQIFVMIDACNAGATVDSFNRYRDFQRRSAQQVGRSAGISVLTATRRDQQAVELRSLGHGLFSHVALQGLAGQADRQPQDGTITAHELAAFVGERLEARSGELAARSLAGQPAPSLQSPAYFVIGADFPIGTVRR